MDFEQDKKDDSMHLPLTGIILCGGRSRRMGRAKAFLPYEGTTMLAHIVKVLGTIFSKVMLVSNEPSDYEDFGLDVVKDILPHRGPLGGILSGLLVAETDHSFVVACDMPLVDERLIREMAAARFDRDVVILSHPQGLEPLLGVYSKTCIKPLEESLFSGQLSVHDLLGSLNASLFDYSRRTGDGTILPPYFNINTPEDYSRLITNRGASVRTLPDRNKH